MLARLLSCDLRLRLAARAFGGTKTGAESGRSVKTGSEHHLITDANGVPLACLLTAANRHDVTQLLPLVEAIPPVRGARGRSRRRPATLLADRGYDSQPHRQALRARGIRPIIAKRKIEHGSHIQPARQARRRKSSRLPRRRERRRKVRAWEGKLCSRRVRLWPWSLWSLGRVYVFGRVTRAAAAGIKTAVMANQRPRCLVNSDGQARKHPRPGRAGARRRNALLPVRHMTAEMPELRVFDPADVRLRLNEEKR